VKEIGTDVVVIGSGFGGALAAHVLVESGRDVVMLERGAWPMHPAVSNAPRTVPELDPFFGLRNAYRRGIGGNGGLPGQQANVGGPSLYFAAVSSRFRAADFEPAPEIVGDSGAEWPYRYDDLEPFYSAAETLLGIAGPVSGGATEPYHSAAYPQTLGRLTATAQRLHDAAARLGLRPYRLPLAINFDEQNGRAPCTACPYCDGFACLIAAKNDIATHVIPRLLHRGLRVEANTTVIRLHAARGRVSAVEAVRVRTGEIVRFRPGTVVLAAGSLGSPALLLASGLERENPAGELVGRFLMRHCNAHAFGIFRHVVDAAGEFHKQIGIDDFYFGHPNIIEPPGKLGSMQQMATPWAALVNLPQRLAPALARLIDHMTGFLVIAEDQPRAENRVTVDRSRRDRWGGPAVHTHYRNTKRDFAARAALLREAKRVLREAGAVTHIIWPIRTFSHAVGTLRMGRDPRTSVLDEFGGYRGLENLFVTDGSIMPTSAGVNPSLTIAANALRAAQHIAGEVTPARAQTQSAPAQPRLSVS
jgi:choline dehydrogenase-like flavoprotein